MKLNYHTGKNFGDALNAMIFPALAPQFFDEDESEIFLGIGSIIGLFKLPENCKKVYIFSSGYAKGDESTYGKIPTLDNRFEVLCVRGNLTAKELGIPASKAVSDGAILLPLIHPVSETKKKYKFSFMPHVGTLNMSDQWEKICSSSDVHFIDPRKNPSEIIEEMVATEVLLTEAMHGAIVADSYRVPWVAIKTTTNINEFKWSDYLLSVELTYQPHELDSLYSFKFLRQIFSKKMARLKLSFFSWAPASAYFLFQQIIKIPRLKRKFRNLKTAKTSLCAGEVLKQKQNQLLEIFNGFLARRK